jgi:hypothetical protein
MTQTSTIERSNQTAIRPFRVSFPEEELADLRKRITATKWPERETVADDTQGVQLATIQKLALLGDGPRLAQGRSETELLPAFHHRDRWADIHFAHSFEA